MQEDSGLTLFIGVANSCNDKVLVDVQECCQKLTTLNTNGGSMLLAKENTANFQFADYIVTAECNDIFITNNNNDFKVRLSNENQLSELLYALTSSWFLANLVGHDYADYVSCLKVSKSLQLDIFDIDSAEDLSAFFSTKKSKPPIAITCNIEAPKNSQTIEWFKKIGAVIEPFVTSEIFAVVSMSSRPNNQTNSKIYLTTFKS
ncbi:hypothetical protein [Litorilituus lipolyticus]|uniref:Uncharacterized protein n=1 Tax=Litorilituus lipolyticus TaxID=2491017 RepID=A0A502KP85_9GAMM|nr:hypothetical protein [Litorilituus lipolyticus]TPH13266.1 hypothetical protein EPA86_13815 [Litorilituus lipolyticus]